MADRVVDVLVPAYNAGKTIRLALDSVRHQTVGDIRILVVDDGSTDDTAEIVTAMSETDPRINILRKSNGGIVDALNFGLAQCRAEFLARHDADDLAAPDRFAKQISYLRSNSDCVAVSGAIRHIDETGRPIGSIARLKPPELADPLWVPQREPYLMHPFLMARREALIEVGGYRYAFHAEDTDLYWRLSEIGRLHNLQDVLGDYRMHTRSVSGASVINGRIGALNSQLAGISALRRRAGQPDLAFRKDALQEYQQADSLERIFQLGSRFLSKSEADRLEITLAGKMLDLASFRPFELTLEDCRFIQRGLRKQSGMLTPSNRAVLERMRASMAARMASEGRIHEAIILLQPALLPWFCSRLAFRILAPRFVLQSFRRATGRDTFFK